MGQGNYYGLLFGIIKESWYNEELFEEMSNQSISLDSEGSYGIKTSYESDDDYFGIFIAVTDGFLSKWWGTGHLKKIPIRNVDKFIEKEFPIELEQAKQFWSQKIEPILKKYKTNDKPEIHLIKDFD